jgi:hypothetical protein
MTVGQGRTPELLSLYQKFRLEMIRKRQNAQTQGEKMGYFVNLQRWESMV